MASAAVWVSESETLVTPSCPAMARARPLKIKTGDVYKRQDVDELAKEGFVLDDADVFLDGDAAGQAFGEGCEPGDAADGFDFFAAGEFFTEGDDVDDVVAVDELAHAGEDALVGGEREVLRAEGAGGLAVGVIVEEDGAEDGAFGVEGGGEAALEFDVGGGSHDLQRV